MSIASSPLLFVAVMLAFTATITISNANHHDEKKTATRNQNTDGSYPTPARDWFTGHWMGNPIYSPVGPFVNYTLTFRPPSHYWPPDTFFVETGSLANSLIHGSYQQWTIVGNTISYCGVLTPDGGRNFLVTRPQFVYIESMSSEFIVHWCGRPTGGGCATFSWTWQLIDNETLFSQNLLNSIPHQQTTFKLTNIDQSQVPINEGMRAGCTYVLGNEPPYNYDWLDEPNSTSCVFEKMSRANKRVFKDLRP